MTYNEFKNKYNGKVVDYDGSYGGQCWDLVQQYFTECLKLSPNILGGCGLVSNMLNEPKIDLLLKYFDEVSTNNMCAGDVVIWAKGHIAIFNNFDGFNNYYLTQNPGSTRIATCNLGGIVRAFRLKESNSSQGTTKYLNLKPSISSWTVYKTNNYYIPSKLSDVQARLNPMKFGGLSYKILEDMGNYHFKIKTDMFGIVYIAGNPYKYDCSITEQPLYKNGNY